MPMRGEGGWDNERVVNGPQILECGCANAEAQELQNI